MSNVADANAVKAPKEAKADKVFIDQGGGVVPQASATGIRYTSLADKKVFEFEIPGAEAGSIQTMLALFGASTLATNRASANRTAIKNGDDGAYESDVDAISERFASIEQGDWGVERGGGIGIDVAALHEAINNIKPYRDQAHSEKVLDRLNSEPEYRAELRKHSNFRAEYDRVVNAKKPVPATEKDADELLG